MFTHKPNTDKPITIGKVTYKADKDGYYYFPYEYKIYNPCVKPKKKVKKVEE